MPLTQSPYDLFCLGILAEMAAAGMIVRSQELSERMGVPSGVIEAVLRDLRLPGLVSIIPESAAKALFGGPQWQLTARGYAQAMEFEPARSERDRLSIALHDAIRRPMGTIPESAEGLVSHQGLDEAEKRRVAAAAIQAKVLPLRVIRKETSDAAF